MAQPQVLPKELRLTAAPTMPQARSYMFKQKSTLPSYNPQQTIQINIPRLQRTYLTKDSYLKFNVNMVLGTNGFGWSTGGKPNLTVCLDTCGAFGLFDKIEVYDYLGSTLLESISGHGQLMSLLLDSSNSKDKFGSIDAATMGTMAPVIVNDNTGPFTFGSTGQKLIPAPYGAAIIPTPTPVSQTEWTTTAAANPVVKEFAIPLTSFLGWLSDKYAPLHNGYTIQLTLNSWQSAFGIQNASSGGTTTTDPTITITDVYFCAQALELGPVAESMLLSSTGGQPLIVPSRTYRNYNGIIGGSDTSFRLDLNLNVASMTSLLWAMRPNADISAYTKPSLSQRVRNYLQSWYFQYGSSILPQTSGIQAYAPSGNKAGATGFTESYIEAMKARRNWSKFDGSVISGESYSKDLADGLSLLVPTLPSNSSSVSDLGKFFAGINLELVPGKDIICGLNTNGMNTSINLTFRDDKNKSVVTRIDAWCEYDSFINVTPGLATTVSF